MTENGGGKLRAAGFARLALTAVGAVTLTVGGAFGGASHAIARTTLVSGPMTDTKSSGGPAGPASTAAAGGAPHIMLIVEENEGYSNVIGSSSAPYLNSLAKSYASATNWYGVQHNSPHDYLDVTIGSDLNLPNGMPYSVPMVVDELHGAGVAWKGYEESMPSNCAKGSTSDGLYDANHNPFHYFTKYSSASGGWCNSANLASEGVLPAPSASGLVTALDGGNAPDFVFLVPNDCDDMHGDTSAGSPCAKSSNAQLIKAGDTWLSNLLPGVLNSTWFSQDGIVIITWDEGSDSSGCCGLSSPGGHIPTLVVSAANQGSGAFGTTGDHYGTLRAIEEAYGVGFLGNSAKTVHGDLTGAFGGGKPATGSISGTVTDAQTTSAITGATVTCTCSGGAAVTGAGGGYSFTAVSPGNSYSMVFSDNGHVSQTVNNVTVTAGKATTENVALVEDGSITGRVTDAGTHLAIAGAMVTCTCQGSGLTTNSSGTYTFSNVAPAGDYTMTFSFAGYASQTLNNVGVSAGHATTENVALAQPTGGITGRVTDATATGHPTLAGVSVTCTCQGGGTTTNGAGTYLFTSVAPGSYALTFSESGLVTQTITGIGVTSGTTTTADEALVEDGGVSGTVTDAQTSMPLEGATVTCDGGCSAATLSDGLGDYSLIDVPPGTYSLIFSASGYVTQTVPSIVVAAGATTTVNPVALTEDGEITGTVTDQQMGTPISGATVTCGGCPTTTTTTDASGDFAFVGVPNGAAYTITFSAGGYVAQSVTGVAVTGPNSTVEDPALVEDGGVGGTVVAAGSLTPIQNATVTCTCETGSVATDPTGAYVFTQAAPGAAYTVSVTATGFAGQTSAPFAVNAGAMSTVNVQLAPIPTGLKVVQTFGAANAGSAGTVKSDRGHGHRHGPRRPSRRHGQGSEFPVDRGERHQRQLAGNSTRGRRRRASRTARAMRRSGMWQTRRA